MQPYIRVVKAFSVEGPPHFVRNPGPARPTRIFETEPTVNIDAEWLQSIATNLMQSGPNHHSDVSCTIYKVPEHIRSSDPKAYEPTVVRIGPYHHSTRCLPPFNSMEDHKWRCMHKLMNCHPHLDDANRTQVLLRKCLSLMKLLEPDVRRCYSEEIPLGSDGLAEMMMLDGCFILHLLLNGKEFTELSNSQMREGLWVLSLVTYDLLLLENQIPFFVVTELFDLLRTQDVGIVDLGTQALKLFSDIHLLRSKNFPENEQVHHLLHLIYLSSTVILPPQQSRPRLASLSPEWIPSATELQDAGLKFKRGNKARSFLDIKSSHGIIQIPPILIDDYSKNLFRNLIAFEQCYPHTDCHITNYVSFMDCIINTPKDVRLLHLNGILNNMMSADQGGGAAHFFSNLGHKVHYSMDTNYLRDVFKHATMYHESRWQKWRAGLVRDYFSNPWAIISVGAAVLLLLLTATQSFFAAYSYFRPTKSS